LAVEANWAQLTELVERVGDVRLRTSVGTVAGLDDVVAAFNPTDGGRGRR